MRSLDSLILFICMVDIWIDKTSSSGPCALLEPQGTKCIPLGAINRAFRDARLYFGLHHPVEFPPHKTHHHLHEIDKLGMILTQTTKYLAKEFELSHDQIFHLLPQLDIELTDIWGFCPAQFIPKDCKLSRYRDTSGQCNNLNHAEWGAPHTPFAYLIPPQRPDGVDYPKDPNGHYLPSARVVSSTMHRDHIVHDHSVTIMLIAWGQIIDHDITFTAETKDPDTHKDHDCCSFIHDHDHHKPSFSLHHNCYPIQIPIDDPFYSSHGHHCMNFARSFAGVRPNCRLGPRTALNTISSFVDASFVYGSNEHLNEEVRVGKYGLLRSLPMFHKYGLKDLLPLKFDYPDDGCIRPSRNIYCFLAGDNRVNEQLILTVLHTLFMREHNKIALKLSKINPHWEDQRLYHETRRIIIAVTQHITYKEFLPMVLGKSLMKEYGISVENEGFWDGYDPNIDPSATEEFITSAFRFGHSLLPHQIERWSLIHRHIESIDLSKLLRQPFDLYKPGYIDTFIMGMTNQLAQAMDEGVTEEVTTMLFKKPYKHFGMDLAAMNIQRGRDHAVAGYTAYRKMCGLPIVHHWEDLHGLMRNETIAKYQRIYRTPHDIDLWSGGVSEIPNYGSLIGPTFGCIIAKQFQALRYGDRYWYELPGLPSSFTEEQLLEIKKMKLSRLLCDNSDAVKSIQVYAMVLGDPELNPRVPCQGMVLPRIDLGKWHQLQPHEEGHGHGHTHKYNSMEHNHLTLHPPKFDPYFLNSVTDNHTSFHQSNKIYTDPHKVTQYLQEPLSHPNPEHTDAVFYHPKNPYPIDNVAGFENQRDQLPPDHYGMHVGHIDSTKIDSGPELLETLEAPPVESSLLFFPNTNPTNHDIHHYRVPLRKPSKPSPPRVRSMNPFPNSPFPGLDGVFSPNPGYLVKQRFSLRG